MADVFGPVPKFDKHPDILALEAHLAAFLKGGQKLIREPGTKVTITFTTGPDNSAIMQQMHLDASNTQAFLNWKIRQELNASKAPWDPEV